MMHCILCTPLATVPLLWGVGGGEGVGGVVGRWMRGEEVDEGRGG